MNTQSEGQMTVHPEQDGAGDYRKPELVRTLRDWREGTAFSPKGRVINWLRLVSTVLDRTICEWEPPSGTGPYEYNALATEIEEAMRRITAGHGGPHPFTLFGFEPGDKSHEAVSLDMTYRMAAVPPGRGIRGHLPGQGMRALPSGNQLRSRPEVMEEIQRTDFSSLASANMQWAVEAMMGTTGSFITELRNSLNETKAELVQVKAQLSAANEKIRQMQDTEHSRKLQIMKTITWQESIQSLVDVVRGVLPLVAAKLLGNDAAQPSAEMDMLITALGPLFEEFDARHGEDQVKAKMEHIKQAVTMKNMPAFIMMLKMYADRKNATEKKREEMKAKIQKGLDGVNAIDKATTAEIVQKGVDAFIHPDPGPQPIPIVEVR